MRSNRLPETSYSPLAATTTLKDLVQIRLGINQPTIPIETQQRPPFVALAGDDVFSRQHGRREAPVLMEVQRQNQIVTAGDCLPDGES